MYSIEAKIKVGPYKKLEFQQTISSLQRDEVSENRASNLKLVEDNEDQNYFSLINRWNTEGDLEEYLSGENFKILLGAVQVLCEESVVQYQLIPNILIHHFDPMFNLTNEGSKFW
jgi:quinol monooxygenase YgiN